MEEQEVVRLSCCAETVQSSQRQRTIFGPMRHAVNSFQLTKSSIRV